MNYLAHFQLSHCDDNLIIGALLGDFVKGPLTGTHPEGWEQGIQLHRQIDAFTDRHPQLSAFSAQLAPHFRRFGGIMLDVSFDYFLYRHWPRYHPSTSQAFIEYTYQLLNQQQLPNNAQRFATLLSEHDVLNQYRDWSMVDRVLKSISQRLRVANPLAEAGAVLDQHQQQLEALFLSFYPQLQQYVSDYQQQSALDDKRIKQ